MQTKTMTRLANISEEQAIKGLKARYPGATIAAFSTIDTVEGPQYKVTLKLAEFPPAKDAPKDEDESGDSFTDIGGEEDEEDPKDPLDLTGDEDEDSEGEDKPKEPTMTEVMDLVKQIAEKVGVPTGDEDPLADPLLDEDPNALPDSGAPVAGEPAPMPAPIPEKPGPGMGAFASAHPDFERVADRRHFVIERDDAGELGNAAMILEAHAQFPGFRVAKIDRIAKAEENIALVALVKKG